MCIYTPFATWIPGNPWTAPCCPPRRKHTKEQVQMRFSGNLWSAHVSGCRLSFLTFSKFSFMVPASPSSPQMLIFPRQREFHWFSRKHNDMLLFPLRFHFPGHGNHILGKVSQIAANTYIVNPNTISLKFQETQRYVTISTPFSLSGKWKSHFWSRRPPMKILLHLLQLPRGGSGQIHSYFMYLPAYPKRF